jgi:hypothetical protein
MSGMTTGNEMTPAQYADGERDALAIAAAFVRKDMEAVDLISRNSNANAVITALLNLLFRSLADSKTDPGTWIDRRQAQLRKAASDDA